jgi:hypothetical protein
VPNLHPALAWLHTQANALLANFGNVAANRPEPARQVVISTLVTVGVVWAVVRIVKKFSK